MTTIERYLQAWMVSGKDQEIQKTVSEICRGSASLPDIVKALGKYLTAEEEEPRTKGVEFLSNVLHIYPPEKLNRQSALVLTVFYCHKLGDTETIVPALKGLVPLVKCQANGSDCAIDVLRAIFLHAKMSALTQPARYLVFSIIDTIVARHREALKAINSEFLQGYLSLVEGEKDPRNLIVAFAICRVLLIEFDISDYVEDFFNITFCYFPITFRPPPSGTFNITADDLRISLRGCLSATAAFGALAIPVFLEKLAAGSPQIKRDVLQTVTECLPLYGSSVAHKFAHTMWDSFKIEVFQPTDAVTEEEALKATKVLVKTTCANEIDGKEGVQTFPKEICEECIEILQEPEKSRAKHSIKILCALVQTTSPVSAYTLGQAVPLLVRLFLNADEISNRSAILSLLSDLLQAAREWLNGALPFRTESIPLPFKEEVLGVLTAGLRKSITAVPALDGLRWIVTTKSLLTDTELGFIVHNVNELLLADPREFEDARDAALDVLYTISLTAPKEIEKQTLSLLFGSLPDKAPHPQAVVEQPTYNGVLSGLSKLCVSAELFEILVIRLTAKLDLLCSPFDYDDSEIGRNLTYICSILVAIADTLTKKVDRKHPDVPKYIDRLVPYLLDYLILLSLSSGKQNIIATDHRIVAIAARILALIVETLPVSKQGTLVVSLYSRFFPDSILGESKKSVENPQFFPFRTGVPPSQKCLVPLLAATTISLRDQVAIPVDDISDFLERLVVWSLEEASDAPQRETTWYIIASVVNKRTEDVSAFLSDKSNMIWNRDIASPCSRPERRRNALTAWYWITKAILVRNHERSALFFNRMFTLFEDDAMSWDAARLLGELGGSDQILTKRKHAILKTLHAQKYFDQVLPRIVEGATSSLQPLPQSAYLVALGSLLKAVPKATYIHEMPSLITLLIRGIELPDASVRANMINALLAVSDPDSNVQALITEHIATLIPAMLKSSKLRDVTSVRVRISALKFLAVLPSLLRYDKLYPYKARVIFELGDVLDDPKRSVRREAVDARTKWQV